jgi:mycothiol synthase
VTQSVRAPTSDDFEDVLALVQAADVAAIGETDWTRDALRDEWQELDLHRDAWVIELDGRIGAYATFEDRGAGRLVADGYVHPELRERGLGSKLLDVTQQRAQSAVAAERDDLRVYLQNATLVADDCTPNLYARRGYEPTRYQFRMLAELDAPPSVTTVPGVEIRLYREPDERAAVYSVLQDSFATGPYFHRSPYEEFERRVFGRRGFDASLLWVATEAGEIVAVNVCGWKQYGDWGWVGSLGVLPGRRGRGIGEALLRTALAEFWRRGERRIALGVDADNPHATRLYERAGMRVFYKVVIYEKELKPATG